MAHEPSSIEPTLSEHELIEQRRQKLQQLREQGIVYPNGFRREHYAADLFAEHADKTGETLQAENHAVQVAGRIMLRRLMGKASFIHIQDMTGRIQIYVRQNDVSDETYEAFKKWDIGDIVGVTGKVFKTKTGELSVHADSICLLTKSLRPLPDKFHGLADQETRYRKRYIDLVMNESSRKVFAIRSAVITGIRQFFNDRRFMEVETPMMQVIPGGANAKPFITHHNALDMPLYLRIAPELYLKRLVVGGIERVYEINRNFRNEGLSTRHNPEFTMLEFYQAYATYHDLMDITESLLRELTTAILGSSVVTYQNATYDFGKPFARISVFESILQHNPSVTAETLSTLAGARQFAESLGIHIEPSYGLGKVQIEIFEKTVEPNLLEPTFITEYPAETSPLARRNDANPFITDRFEFFVAGREIANGFSELNDAEDQAARFQEQVQAKDSGDDEAMHYDSDYIEALEIGLPPTAGEGIGIDRLVMLLTDSPSIRDVILFPHMRLQTQL